MNKTVNNLVFNRRESLWRKSNTEKYPGYMSRNTNKPISQRLPFLLVKYECSFHCTLITILMFYIFKKIF